MERKGDASESVFGEARGDAECAGIVECDRLVGGGWFQVHLGVVHEEAGGCRDC